MFFDLSLWFDVESKYEATNSLPEVGDVQLWFDVESKYEATSKFKVITDQGCGLMQNQNMKQQRY